MSLAIIISKDSFESKDKSITYHQATLSDGKSVFLKEDKLAELKVGDMVATTVKKYQDKAGKWQSSIIITKVNMAA